MRQFDPEQVCFYLLELLYYVRIFNLTVIRSSKEHPRTKYFLKHFQITFFNEKENENIVSCAKIAHGGSVNWAAAKLGVPYVVFMYIKI